MSKTNHNSIGQIGYVVHRCRTDISTGTSINEYLSICDDCLVWSLAYKASVMSQIEAQNARDSVGEGRVIKHSQMIIPGDVLGANNNYLI